MAYTDADAVRLHAPAALASEDFAGHITQAEGIIDAKLQGIFDLPLAAIGASPPTPQIIQNIASRLAAGRFLLAQYGGLQADAPKYPRDLINEAMKDLMTVVANPSQLDLDRKELTTEDLERDRILVSDENDPVFNMGGPLGWG